jgi:hypothetical protein
MEKKTPVKKKVVEKKPVTKTLTTKTSNEKKTPVKKKVVEKKPVTKTSTTKTSNEKKTPVKKKVVEKKPVTKTSTTKTSNNLVVVGRTTPGYWKSISEQGFLNDFPGSTFTIDKPSKFPELSQGVVSVPEPLSKRFLEIKKQMTKQNGGRWIIWD